MTPRRSPLHNLPVRVFHAVALCPADRNHHGHAGASRIGDLTIRNLVETFKAKKEIIAEEATYTIESVANQFKDFVMLAYEREIPEA